MHTPWDVSTAIYENKYKNISEQESSPLGMFIKPDGTKMYVLGIQHDTIYQFALSTPGDVNTAVYENKFKYVGDEDISPHDIDFRPDGLKMYMVGEYTDKVYQYSLSVAWDVDTAIYENKFKDVRDQDQSPRGVFFKPDDGLKMYIIGKVNKKVFQYSLSEAWEIETAVYEDKYKDLSAQDDNNFDVSLSPDGNRMYTVGYNNKKIFQYLLSTSWDVDTADYEDKFKYVGDEEASPYSVTFAQNGAKMYVIGITADTVFQYNLPIGETFYKSIAGSFDSTGKLTNLPKKILEGSLTSSGNILKKISITIQGAISFFGSLFTGRFLNATLSIKANDSILSIDENRSALSIDENESILSIEE